MRANGTSLISFYDRIGLVSASLQSISAQGAYAQYDRREIGPNLRALNMLSFRCSQLLASAPVGVLFESGLLLCRRADELISCVECQSRIDATATCTQMSAVST